jgi:hypothetical protein
MSHHRVRDTDGALAYLTDCTLATVTHLASMKSASKSELRRQISIAQMAIDWMNRFGVAYGGTRAEDVMAMGGKVETWAEQFKP